MQAGRVERTQRLATSANSLPLGPTDLVRLSYIQQTTAPDLRAGAPEAARANVQVARALAANGEPDLALRLLATSAFTAFTADQPPAIRSLLLEACSEIAAPADDPRVLAIHAHTDPVKYGRYVLELAIRRSATAITEPDAMYDLAAAMGALGAKGLAEEHLMQAVTFLRTHGMLRVLTRFLVISADAAFRLGRWSSAEADTDECIRLSQELHQPPVWEGAARALRANLAAVRGEHDSAKTLAAEAEQTAFAVDARSLHSMAGNAHVLNALGAGLYEQAFQRLAAMFDPDSRTYHSFWSSFLIGDFAEAAAATGRHEDARKMVEKVESLTGSGSPNLLIAIRHARALLAGDDAQTRFQEALTADLGRYPFQNARLHLAYGAWLRRQRRSIESRVPLRVARDLFDGLGANPWGERARLELRASGEKSQARATYARETLTPQEQQIAAHAAQGLSNREIGERLFLSHRTIGSHLYRIYPKLNITSRHELRDALEHATISAQGT